MRSGKYRSGIALGFVAASVFSWPAIAAQPSSVPNFSGVIWGRNWPLLEDPPSGPKPVTLTPKKFDSKIAGDHTNPILKPAAAAIVKKRGDWAKANNDAPPDPHNQCWPEITPFILSIQFGVQILQEKDKVTLLYIGDHKVRHVPLNVPHPAKVTPSSQGHSVGHYEGDTLVIDTVGQKVGPYPMLDVVGTPYSSALHVIERYRLIDGVAARNAVEKFERPYFPPGMSNPITNEYGRGIIDVDTKKKGLQVEVTVEDPNMFTTPWKTLITYRPTIGNKFPEAVCAENVKNAVVPTAKKADF